MSSSLDLNSRMRRWIKRSKDGKLERMSVLKALDPNLRPTGDANLHRPRLWRNHIDHLIISRAPPSGLGTQRGDL